MDEETKRKIGAKNKINMTGKKASEATRKKMSDTHKKIPMHPNSLKNIALENRKPLTEEQIEYLRKINTGENNPTHKYSNEQILEVKRLLDEGIKPIPVSNMTGVGLATVRRVQRKETRKDIIK